MPMDAVREAIINGFAHRSYRSDLALQIEIYPDSIEIFSTGWFPSGQTPEAHLSGEDKSSNGRNKLIASTLFKSKEIESFGTGLPRIKRLCDAEGISFTYEKNAYGTIVIFHRNDPFAEGMPDSNRGPLHTDGAILPEAALVVYDLIRNSPSISIPEISQQTNRSIRTIERLVKVLREQGVIRREGSNKTGYWVVLKECS
ncbi:MAG: ATP-binding protein [Gordonibacter sp.]|uniref:ATP-binding protein n=1 Tax=Gordonibacter sp. TaxID=1968902 RepID=UPI002FCA5BDD